MLGVAAAREARWRGKAAPRQAGSEAPAAAHSLGEAMAARMAPVGESCPQLRGAAGRRKAQRGSKVDTEWLTASFSYLRIAEGLEEPTPDRVIGGGQAAHSSLALLARLRAKIRQRVLGVVASPRLATTLRWFDAFLLGTERVPFLSRAEYGDSIAFAYNSDTLVLFAEFVRQSASLRRSHLGEVSAGAIGGYVSAITALATAVAGGEEVVRKSQTRSATAKSMRIEDGPVGQRALCAGFRSADMLRAAAVRERVSSTGARYWAIMLAGINLILRGGELGTVDAADFDAERDLSWASFVWKEACAESNGLPWVEVIVVSIKDTAARAKPHRIPVRRRSSGAQGADPLCLYDALRIYMATHAYLTQGRQPHEVPFFVDDQGSVVTTSFVKGLVRSFAAAIGLDAELFGARSLRIGGATDWMEVLGREEGRAVIKQRGRWASDCDLIYERALLRTHLEGSAAIGVLSGRDLERALPGWVQPALRH